MVGDRPTRDLKGDLPFGCISPGALRELATAIERLDSYHHSVGGFKVDRPCLRRIEAQGDRVVAFVSTGPAVGGAWFIFELTPSGWLLREKENE